MNGAKTPSLCVGGFIYSDNMGFSKRNEEWDHVPIYRQLWYLLFFRRYINNEYTRWWRFVDAEHVKFLVEKLPGNNYVGRSVFRSVQQYSDISEISNVSWYTNALGHYDSNTDQMVFSILPNSIPDSDFRNIYKQLGGSGKW